MRRKSEKGDWSVLKMLQTSIFRRSTSSIDSSLCKVSISSHPHFHCPGVAVVLCCILIAVISRGESRPIRFASVHRFKGESEEISFTGIQYEAGNGRVAMNNSKSFETISEKTESWNSPDKMDLDPGNGHSSGGGALRRRKRGFFDKVEERQRLEEEYDRSFRLFWFLGGVAIVFFILIFILTLLCFCCPNLANNKKRKESSSTVPRISVPTVDGLDTDGVGGLVYQPSPGRMDVEMRTRSPSVFSANNVMYSSHHRLSQEQVNAIQLQSQTRRNSALPMTSQSCLAPTNALIDVNVIQEYRGPEVS